MYEYKDGEFKKWPKYKIIIHKLKNNPLAARIGFIAIPCVGLLSYGIFAAFRISSAAEKQRELARVEFVMKDKRGKLEGEFSAREFMTSDLSPEEKMQEIKTQLQFFSKLYFDRYVYDEVMSGKLVKPAEEHYKSSSAFEEAQKEYRKKMKTLKFYAKRDATAYVEQKFHMNEQVYASDGATGVSEQEKF